jgi:hypothetical protein
VGPVFLQHNMNSQRYGICLEDNFSPFLQGMDWDLNEMIS